MLAELIISTKLDGGNTIPVCEVTVDNGLVYRVQPAPEFERLFAGETRAMLMDRIIPYLDAIGFAREALGYATFVDTE